MNQMNEINCEQVLKKIEEQNKSEDKQGLMMNREGFVVNRTQLNKQELSCQFCEICRSKIERSTWRNSINVQGSQIIISEADKKKLKKKEYKKRQQLKQHLRKEEKVFGVLRSTIHQIFALKTDYLKQKHVILQCLEVFHDEIQFRSFMHTALETELELIRKELLNLILPLELQTPSVSIIPNIYQQFERVRQAVPELQKIINHFLNYNQHISKYHTNLFIDLNHLIFKLLLSQEHKKKLTYLCLSLLNTNFTHHERQKIMIKEILSLTEELSQQSQESYDVTNSANSEEPQTINQNDLQNLNTVKVAKKNKKKKNYDLVSTYENTSSILQNLQIDQERLPCNVNQQWILKLDQQISALRKR